MESHELAFNEDISFPCPLDLLDLVGVVVIWLPGHDTFTMHLVTFCAANVSHPFVSPHDLKFTLHLLVHKRASVSDVSLGEDSCVPVAIFESSIELNEFALILGLVGDFSLTKHAVIECALKLSSIRVVKYGVAMKLLLIVEFTVVASSV